MVWSCNRLCALWFACGLIWLGRFKGWINDLMADASLWPGGSCILFYYHSYEKICFVPYMCYLYIFLFFWSSLIASLVCWDLRCCSTSNSLLIIYLYCYVWPKFVFSSSYLVDLLVWKMIIFFIRAINRFFKVFLL